MQAVLERIEWNQNKMRLALLWPPPYLFFFFFLSLSLILFFSSTNDERSPCWNETACHEFWLAWLYIYMYIRKREERRRARLQQYRRRNPEPSPAGPSSSLCLCVCGAYINCQSDATPAAPAVVVYLLQWLVARDRHCYRSFSMFLTSLLRGG